MDTYFVGMDVRSFSEATNDEKDTQRPGFSADATHTTRFALAFKTPRHGFENSTSSIFCAILLDGSRNTAKEATVDQQRTRGEMTVPLSSFCSECGAANTFQATSCFACNEPLAHSASLPSAQLPFPALPVPVVPPPAVPLGPGSLLHGRYKLVREIGQGGFGVVYLAEDGQRNHRHVAVKQINIGKLSARESIDATDS